MPIRIRNADITKIKADAIVNAANSALIMGGGVCGAIFRAAGAERMRAECEKIGYCPAGGAVHTSAGALFAKYAIHTVGPVWRGGCSGEEALLRSCYRASLALAKELGLSSIAFPLISAGIFGYPKEAAMTVALSEAQNFLLENDMEICFALFGDPKEFLNTAVYRSLSVYLDSVSETEIKNAASMTAGGSEAAFCRVLSRAFTESGRSGEQLSGRANIGHKRLKELFSGESYPKKEEMLALSVALFGDVCRASPLLESAECRFDGSKKADLIVRRLLETGCKDICFINLALFAFGEEQLGERLE